MLYVIIWNSFLSLTITLLVFNHSVAYHYSVFILMFVWMYCSLFIHSLVNMCLVPGFANHLSAPPSFFVHASYSACANFSWVSAYWKYTCIHLYVYMEVYKYTFHRVYMKVKLLETMANFFKVLESLILLPAMHKQALRAMFF